MENEFIFRSKFIAVIIWSIFILIATNNFNFHALIFNQDIGININLNPDFFDLFITTDFVLTKSFLVQKAGHALAFGILFLLLGRCIANKWIVVILCGCFAMFTEVLQLFFERNGRFFDVF